MCRSKTPERALSRPTSPGFFSRCSRPQRVVWEWAFRSANQSLKTMTVGFGYPQEQTGARFSNLNCRWQPARLKQPELVQSGRSRRFQGNSGDDTDINGRPLLALSGHRLVRCTCLLLTQSGHLRPFTRPFNPRVLHGTMLCATRGGYNEAARVHQACWWGGYLAACSERATASYACHRVHERALT